MKSFNSPTKTEVKTAYKSQPIKKSLADKFSQIISNLSDSQRLKVEESFDKIINISVSFPLKFKKDSHGSWCALLSSGNLKDINLVRTWLKDFTLNRLNEPSLRAVYLKHDMDHIHEVFCLESLKLQEISSLNFDIKERTKNRVGIIHSSRIINLIRRTGAFYNGDDHLIELNYPYVTNDTNWF
jgi:hypothetical protein